MALRLDYGVDVPGSDQTALMPIPEQTPMAAPLTGLPAMLPPITPGTPPMLPGATSDFDAAIKKALISVLQETTQPQQQQEPRKGLGWLAMIPGYAQGVQKRQAFEQQQETLKLQQQAMKGQQASQQLQRLVMLHKLQQQQQEEETGRHIGQLFAQGKDMSDPATQQQVLGMLGNAGMPVDQLMKLHQSFAAQRELSQNAQVGAGGALPAAGAPAATPPTEGAAPAPTGMMMDLPQAPAPVSPSFAQKVSEVSQRLGMDPTHLMQIMNFETGGTFSTSMQNQAGSGATGLIQFMPSTAENMGTTTQHLARMTPEQQLDYVEQYFTPYKGKLGNLQDAYMAVLYPKAIGKSPETVLFKQGTPEYFQNAGLDRQSKGTVTVADATQAVADYARRTGLGGPAQGPGGGPPVATNAGGAAGMAPGGPPSRGQEAMQLDLARLMARRDQLMQVQQALRALKPVTEAGRKDIDTRMDNVRQDLTALNTNIQQVQQQMEPGDLFKAMLRQNNGNLALTQRQYMDFEIEKARRTQEAGLVGAAERAAGVKRAEIDAARQAYGEQTLTEAQKAGKAPVYYDVVTAKETQGSKPYAQVREDEAAGKVVPVIDPDTHHSLVSLNRSIPVLADLREDFAKIFEKGGIYENLAPQDRAAAAIRGTFGILTQSNKALAVVSRRIESNLEKLARSIGDVRGAGTEGDVNRMRAGLPQLQPWKIPDSKEVAYELYNKMLDSVNGIYSALLRQDTYQHPRLKPLGAPLTSSGAAGLDILEKAVQ